MLLRTDNEACLCTTALNCYMYQQRILSCFFFYRYKTRIEIYSEMNEHMRHKNSIDTISICTFRCRKKKL